MTSPSPSEKPSAKVKIMPLTKKGKKTKKAFIEEYGKKKGEELFYKYENKHKGLKKNGK